MPTSCSRSLICSRGPGVAVRRSSSGRAMPGLSLGLHDSTNPSRLKARGSAGFYSPMIGSVMAHVLDGDLFAIPLGFAGRGLPGEVCARPAQAELDSWSAERRAAPSADRAAAGASRPIWCRRFASDGPRMWAQDRPAHQPASSRSTSRIWPPCHPSSTAFSAWPCSFEIHRLREEPCSPAGHHPGRSWFYRSSSSPAARRCGPCPILDRAGRHGPGRYQVAGRSATGSSRPRLPGMLTGTILAMSRAIGETAPLVVFGGVLFATNQASSFSPHRVDRQHALGDAATDLLLEVRCQEQNFQDLAAPGIIIVLLAVLILMNLDRYPYTKQIQPPLVGAQHLR